MSNTSATGGYLAPATVGLPGGITLNQYFHNVIVGITGLDKTLVRPKWQVDAPKEPPSPATNWCAFGISSLNPDANAYEETTENGTTMQRHEDLSILCSFYGPDNLENASILRDGFQLTQNRDALSLAQMGFTGVSATTNVPELVNNRWYPRCDITIEIKRRRDRKYSVLSIVSADGTITAVASNETPITIPWTDAE